jgi:hypothetical protein
LLGFDKVCFVSQSMADRLTHQPRKRKRLVGEEGLQSTAGDELLSAFKFTNASLCNKMAQEFRFYSIFAPVPNDAENTGSQQYNALIVRL